MTHPLHVVARITARSDTGAEVHARLRGLLQPTRREPGGRRYTLLHHAADPTDFPFVEEWADAAALNAHRAALDPAPPPLEERQDRSPYSSSTFIFAGCIQTARAGAIGKEATGASLAVTL